MQKGLQMTVTHLFAVELAYLLQNDLYEPRAHTTAAKFAQASGA